MIKCPKCQSINVGRTYIVTQYKTIGVNNSQVYEICEGSTKVDPDQHEYYCADCFYEWDRMVEELI